MFSSSASSPLGVSPFATSLQISSDGRPADNGGRRPDECSPWKSRVEWGKRVLALAILCVGALSGFAPSAAGQTAHFSWAMATLGSGFRVPRGVAVDGSGNVFVADSGHSAVKEILAAGGYTTVNTLAQGSGFNQPEGVAVDGNGNVFVTDFFNNAVKEILAAGGYTTVNTLGSLSIAFGVAVDGKGNIWVFGSSENAWVLQQGNFFPSWSDGTAWQEDHGSDGEQDGRESIEAFFPARANSWYLAFIWSQGTCDDSSGGLFGFSFAQQFQNMSVPFVVFGSL